MRRILLLFLLVVGLFVSSGFQIGSSAVSSSLAPSTPLFDHVLLIMMENQNINSTYNCGSQCSAFLTPFADGHGLALNYKRVEDGSLPNYFGLTMGQINQNPFPGADCSPHPGDIRRLPNGTIISNYCPQNSVNIVDRLEKAGLTWKAYNENYPGQGSGTYYSSGGCYLAYSKFQTGNEDATYYAADHNPFVYYTDIVNSTSRCAKIVPANTQHVSNPLNDDILLSDLNGANAPNFMWLSPDECDQMHHSCYPYFSTDNTGSIKQGSDYLSQLIPQVLNSATFLNTRSALFITFDENCAVANPPGCGSTDSLYTVWASQNSQVVKTGFRSNTLYNQYSFLSTVESVWNLAPLTNNDANANSMLEFFNTPTSDFTVSANPMSVAANAGVTGSSTITVSPINGFTGTVNLSVGTNSTSLGCTLSPTTITGGSGSSTLRCAGSFGGNFLAAVTGMSGSISHSVGVTYHVTAPPPPAGAPAYVVVIVLENQGLSATYGSGCSSTDCGYITQLANTYGLAVNYSGVGHLSLVNYLTLTSGGNYSDYSGSCSSGPDVFSCDCYPSSTCQVSGTGTNIVDTVEQSGRTWRAYMEDYKGGCFLSDATGGRAYNATDPTTVYDSNHNPFVYYTDINSSATRCLNIVDANTLSTGYFAGPNGSLPTALLSDLNGQNPPNLMWLSPNKCNDGHDYARPECPVSDPVAEQNNYLQALVPSILNSATFKTKPSALYITWDEGATCPNPGQTFPTCTDPVTTIWAGPTVRLGYQSNHPYSHYSFITTLETAWNLRRLPIPPAANAPDMSEFFIVPSFDFQLSNSGPITINSRNTGNNTITVSLLNGTSQNVSLTCNWFPPGAQCSFFPLNARPPFTSTLTVTVSNTTQVGNYTVSVTGTATGATLHSIQFKLVVGSGSVGGTIVPVDKPMLLAPYLAVIILATTVASLATYLSKYRVRSKAIRRSLAGSYLVR